MIPPGPDDPIKARWMGFYNGAGIHGTDEVASLGTAASHGCVRMSIPDVDRALRPGPARHPDLHRRTDRRERHGLHAAGVAGSPAKLRP